MRDRADLEREAEHGAAPAAMAGPLNASQRGREGRGQIGLEYRVVLLEGVDARPFPELELQILDERCSRHWWCTPNRVVDHRT